MNTSKFLRVTLSALVGVMALAACNVNLKDKNGVPIGATRIQIVANTGAMPWLEQAAEKLNDGRVKSANKPVYADLISMEAGQAVNEFTRSTATMWIPDDEAWPDVLASRGNTAFKGNCVSTATSPLVIAMWKDIADALGYPARSLGWQIHHTDAARGMLEASETTFWFGFTDDIVIRVRPHHEGSRIDLRSVSRVGRGDLGANARRILRFSTVFGAIES
ncbi:MAG TPA: DUF1499 domain-containing protein, partial [Thermoflexales bacterium]|nr:DUF1499 domain-containing protein [Thermoflexales bacterium]